MKQQGLGFGSCASHNEMPVPPVKLIRNYLSTGQQQALGAEVESYPMGSPEIEVYGRKVVIPRSQVWFGDKGCDYRYSSLLIEALPWPHYALKLRQKLERDFGLFSNGVLVNHYADGSESVGWHSDNEPEIVTASDIASVTLGATRDFVMRHKLSHHKVTLQLAGGDLLIMQGPMQNEWEHALPKRKKVTEPRINFTFRQLLVGFHQA
jgi:alkylated DNA repair dioxygenase AlkB